MADSWEEFDWDNSPDSLASEQIRHEAPEDVRKRGYLTSVGRKATASKTVKEAGVLGSQTNIRFALAFADVLWPFPDNEPAGSPENGDLYWDTDDDPPHSDYKEGVQFPNQRPGSMVCFFNRTFSHPVQAVVKTDDDYEFKFDATVIKKYAIGTQNGNRVRLPTGTADGNIDAAIIEGSAESWYEEEDDFRPGTPFKVTGLDESADDGFYRVKSRRYESNYVYVIVDDNNYEQQDLTEQAGVGGDADCDFPGDWYMFVGMEGHSLSEYNTEGGGDMTDYLDTLADNVYNSGISPEWWSAKDMHHRYEKTGGEVTYGPNDGRPPMGGIESKDFNGNWIRTAVPSLYHTFDDNAHRWIIKAETDGSQGSDYEQFTSVVPSSVFLCDQFDPKEIVSPFLFDDTELPKWKYGSKVKFKSKQLTDPSQLGAINDVERAGYVTSLPAYVPQSRHSQYQDIYVIDPPGGTTGNRTVLGTWPLVSNNHPKNTWINRKYSKSLQNMVEQIIESTEWIDEPNETFKTNWIAVFGWAGIIQIDTSDWSPYSDATTYGEGAEIKVSSQVYVSLQAGNLDHPVADGVWWRKYTYQEVLANYDLDTAWQPNLNADQPFYADTNDEMWDENGSRFEYWIAQTGQFDWYYDTTHPFRSKRTLDDAWFWWEHVGEVSHPLPATYNGVACTTAEDVLNAYWRIPVGTWRKTWKYSLGKPQDNPMADGDEADPAFEDYESLSALPADFFSADEAYSGSNGNDDDCLMMGHHRMTAISPSDDAAIAGRHEESYTVDGHEIYTDNVLSIITAARNILRQIGKLNRGMTTNLLEAVEGIDQFEAQGETFSACKNEYTALSEAIRDGLDLENDYDVAESEPVSTQVTGSFGWSGGNKYFSSNNGLRFVGIEIVMSGDEGANFIEESGQGRTISVLLSAYSTGHYDENGDLKTDPWWNTAGIKGIVDLACLTDVDIYYGFGELRVEDAVAIWDGNNYKFRYKLEHLWYPDSTVTLYGPPEEPFGSSHNGSFAWIADESNNQTMTEFDWDGFSSEIWNRDYERADYKLIDPEP